MKRTTPESRSFMSLQISSQVNWTTKFENTYSSIAPFRHQILTWMSQQLGILQTVVVESPDPNMYVMAMYRRNVDFACMRPGLAWISRLNSYSIPKTRTCGDLDKSKIRGHQPSQHTKEASLLQLLVMFIPNEICKHWLIGQANRLTDRVSRISAQVRKWILWFFKGRLPFRQVEALLVGKYVLQ